MEHKAALLMAAIVGTTSAYEENRASLKVANFFNESLKIFDGKIGKKYF